MRCFSLSAALALLLTGSAAYAGHGCATCGAGGGYSMGGFGGAYAGPFGGGCNFGCGNGCGACGGGGFAGGFGGGFGFGFRSPTIQCNPGYAASLWQGYCDCAPPALSHCTPCGGLRGAGIGRLGRGLIGGGCGAGCTSGCGTGCDSCGGGDVYSGHSHDIQGAPIEGAPQNWGHEPPINAAPTNVAPLNEGPGEVPQIDDTPMPAESNPAPAPKDERTAEPVNPEPTNPPAATEPAPAPAPEPMTIEPAESTGEQSAARTRGVRLFGSGLSD